jgi:hypothetical protein
MALGSTQPLTEMSTRNLPGGKGRPARRAFSIVQLRKGRTNVQQREQSVCGPLWGIQIAGSPPPLLSVIAGTGLGPAAHSQTPSVSPHLLLLHLYTRKAKT